MNITSLNNVSAIIQRNIITKYSLERDIDINQKQFITHWTQLICAAGGTVLQEVSSELLYRGSFSSEALASGHCPKVAVNFYKLVISLISWIFLPESYL
jgi:hypothetical protein